ncbi:MAG TPA: SIR2 family protein [Candidatus Acidoferrales bacterium]|nr:SIR2 family protein [Candidatus Acidoferrales bacterium]
MNGEGNRSERQSPYRGLEPFDELDAAFFFGRERETRLITASLFAAPLTLLYGASGVGKSSVLRAGVLPKLREKPELLPVVFPIVGGQGASGVLRGWQTDPVGGVKEAILTALFASAGDDRSALKRYRDAVWANDQAPLRQFLAACHAVSDRRLMVILDQFEEYSLYHPDGDPFEEQLAGTVFPGDLSASFLVSLREDSLSKLDRFKGRIPTLWDSYRRIDHLNLEAAEDAIRLPLKEYNRSQPAGRQIGIEDELVEEVLRSVPAGGVQFEDTGSGTLGPAVGKASRIETPYLQMVMLRIWERERVQGSTMLRLATLENEGGAPEIVKRHLDRVMEQFTVEERDLAALVFHRLVTPSGAKIAFTANDLAQYENIEPERLRPILSRLDEGNHRILRRVAVAGAPDEPRYEIFHDRLGKAILAWRAKRLKEQEREQTQKDEAEQKRIQEENRARLRVTTDAAMDDLGADGRTMWARIMPYLITSEGKRLVQTAAGLARLSNLTVGAVEGVLKRLSDAGVVRTAYGSIEETHCEIIDDAVAASLLEWHSRYAEAQAAKPFDHPLRLKSSTPSEAFPYRLVRDLFAKGGVVPFLGAGVSISARNQSFPTKNEFKDALARECGFPPAEFDASDIAEIASFHVQRFGRDSLNKWLQEKLGRSDCLPSDTHRFLAEAAKARPLVILTTNYDALMERALAEAGVEFDVVADLGSYPARLDQLAFLPHGKSNREMVHPNAPALRKLTRTLVFRVHGPLFEGEDITGSYVITEEDYIDWLNSSVARSPAAVWVLSRAGLLSLGQSARDWSQRAILRQFCRLYEKESGKIPRSWAVALNPSPSSVRTWQRYRMEVHSIDLDEWAARMREAGSL